MTLRSTLVAAVLVLAATLQAAAFDQPNLKIGQLDLHPYYGLKTIYDDNIYLVPPENNGARVGGGHRGAWIMENNVGLGLALPVGDMHKFTADYDFTAQNYNTQQKANNSINQKADGAYDFKGSVTRARLFDNFLNTQDPQFNPNNLVTGELIKRTRHWQNTGGGAAEYDLGDVFYFGGDAQDTVYRYLEPSLAAVIDRSEDVFGVKAGYKIQPQTKLFAAVHRALVHYNSGSPNNHRDVQADFGVEGQIAPKVKGLVQTGFNYGAYDFVVGQTRYTRTWVVKATVNYKPTEQDTIDLSLTRGRNEATVSGPFYVATGATLVAAHTLNKLTLGANVGMEQDKYSDNLTLGGITANRRDDNYVYGARADYNIQKWLVVGAGYTYLARFSNFSGQFNFRDSRTSLYGKVLF